VSIITADAIWEKVLELVAQSINKQSFETWFKPTRAKSMENGRLVVEVPSRFFCDWLQEHYSQLIHEKLVLLNFEHSGLEFIPAPALQSAPQFTAAPAPVPPAPANDILMQKKIQESTAPIYSSGTPLNVKYTFNSFVVGNSNRFAHAATLAVAEAPARSYNPLFIYGGVGLGKTHLLHAIGNFINKMNPELRVVYVSSETFMNKMIAAIASGTMREFRNIFRTVDVLLIDDIQFLEGKESTQEEFFHTFNDLHNMRKQIVATSDSHPKEIKLEERLRSRFEWGLVADIQPPDFETRVAILSQLALSEKFHVPNDILVYIANQIKSNIRELEGTLNRVIAYSSLTRSELNLDLARHVLRDLFQNEMTPITMEKITEEVARDFNLKLADLKSKKRTATIVLPRQIAMYLSRELTDCSLPEIGKYFGGKDHTTVIYGLDKIKEKITIDEKLNIRLQKLSERLKNNSN
jgi:chromosomal replication initiator protein